LPFQEHLFTQLCVLAADSDNLVASAAQRSLQPLRISAALIIDRLTLKKDPKQLRDGEQSCLVMRNCVVAGGSGKGAGFPASQDQENLTQGPNNHKL
jgi:hypothetical protein